MRFLSSASRLRLKNSKLLVLDVDGVMTDASLLFVEGTGWTRAFSVKDGYGLRLLMGPGFEVALLSGGDSKSVRERSRFLGVQHAYFGNSNKLDPFNELLKITKCTPEDVVYIGDDLFDLDVLRLVGFSVTVPSAVPEVKAAVDYITHEIGGHGAVRELADLIRHAKGLNNLDLHAVSRGINASILSATPKSTSAVIADKE